MISIFKKYELKITASIKMAEAPRTAKQCLLLKSFDMTNGVHMEKFEPELFGSEIIPV